MTDIVDAAMRVFDGIDELKDSVGEELGASPWYLIDQEAIDRFAAATEDRYFIHTDAARARTEAGLESTIGHGLLTLSLGPFLSRSLVEVRGVGSTLNYGYDKVRFTAPVPVDSRLRLAATLDAVDETDQGVKATFRQRFEIEGSDRPVCVADQVKFFWRA